MQRWLERANCPCSLTLAKILIVWIFFDQGHKLPLLEVVHCTWWAILGSNQRPLPCQGSALPLRQSPKLLLGGEDGIRTRVDGFAGRCLASRPLHRFQDSLRADDEIRTRDPNLGKVVRYHCATSALLFSELEDYGIDCAARVWNGCLF